MGERRSGTVVAGGGVMATDELLATGEPPGHGDAPSGHCNHVVLRGRMAAAAESRDLPSGDVVVTFRVIVERDRGEDTRRRVDTIDCAAWTTRAQRSALAWRAGDLVEVRGALRRRFRRAEGGAVSRVEIEVDRARRVRG
jgi:single-strand DNA-binding protein